MFASELGQSNNVLLVFALHNNGVPVNNQKHAANNNNVNIDAYLFWKLHGWIDNVWDRYRAAKNKTANDADYKAWLSWMNKYQPKGDLANSAHASVYAYSAAMAQVLKAAGDDLSRENILKQMVTLKEFAALVVLREVFL